MKVALFGATGKLGNLLLEKALAKKYLVTACVRNPKKLETRHKNLKIVEGDIYKQDTVDAVVNGQDVVISVLGIPTLIATKNMPNICTDGAKAIITAMIKHKVKKLIAVSAFGVRETKNFNLYTRMLRIGIEKHMTDKDLMETEIRKSGLKWVLVRPAAYLDLPFLKKYKVVTHLKGLYLVTTREAVADFIVSQVESNKYIGQAPAISFRL